MDPAVEALYDLVVGELTFLHCSHVPRATHSVDKHLEGYFSLQYMAEGAVDLSYDGAGRRLEGEWFWMAAPGPRIAFHAASGTAAWDHRHAAFQGPTAELWAAQGLLDFRAQRPPSGHDWPGVFDRLLGDIRGGDRWAKLSAVNRVERILLTLAEERAAVRQEPPDWLAHVLAALESGETFSPDYEQLAGRVGMSYSTLRHRFRQSTGMSLHDYVIHQRVRRARDLLAETDLPIKRIASLAGYRDVYFFSRQFTAETGVAPGRYRRSRQI